DGRAGVELDGDVALQVDGVLGLVVPGGELHHPAAGAAGRVDGRLDGRGVVGGAVTLGAVVPHVVRRRVGQRGQAHERPRDGQCSGTDNILAHRCLPQTRCGRPVNRTPAGFNLR